MASLEVLDTSLAHSFATPVKRMHESEHVARFLISKAYRDLGIFILQLNHALCPRIRSDSPRPSVFLLPSQPPVTSSILALRNLLSQIEQLIEGAPPDPGPRRFGNLSFRKWHALLGERLDEFLRHELLGDKLGLGGGNARDEIASYLLGSFGSPQRLDYGTGHELSFIAFLACLWKLAFFQDGVQGGVIEREIVLSVIEPYLQLVRRLITTYTLEPAGSHGVWGLDDHFFVPYIFGSAQLARPITDGEPTPIEGSVRGAPKPSDVTNIAIVDDQRHGNMYFSAIGFIFDVKKGPFWEHSPMLFDISGIRDGWGKINKGMIKMFQADVLSKFPVIQHFPFGSLLSWDEDPQASRPSRDDSAAKTVASRASANVGRPSRQAPWTGRAEQSKTGNATALYSTGSPSTSPKRDN